MNPAAPLYADVADAPAGGRAFWITTADGQRLRAAAWEGDGRGTAIVFPGRSEYVEKYGRVVGRLVARGLAAVVIDWRGQGLSQRHPTTPQLGHVEDFRRYQDDVAALLAAPEVAALPGPRVLVAHSMGGCIGLRTLLEGAHFAAAVFSAPMWRLQMRAATRELTAKMAHLANVLGLGLRLTPGANPRPTALSVAFEGNALTSDPEHFAWAGRQITLHPDLALGGPNVHWTRAAFEEMARLHLAPLPRLPVLTFLGSDETVVSPGVIRAQTARMAAGRLVTLEGARHEVFMERPRIQERIWDEIDGFLAGLAVPAAPSARISR
jgi:lysophospholipase